jgi:4'-phosphopantetheinyl transferase
MGLWTAGCAPCSIRRTGTTGVGWVGLTSSVNHITFIEDCRGAAMPAPRSAGASATVLGARVDMIQRGPELSRRDWLRLVSALPAVERGRIEGLHRWQDRQDSALGWELLHRLARERGATVHRTERGRPRCDPPLDMTLTHSGGWIATAVSQTGRVGIDVEGVRDIAPSLARRCLSHTELDWLGRAAGAATRNHRFCRLWTAKEAYLKAVGVGLAADPREILVDLSGDQPRLLGRASERWQLSELGPAPGVCITLCMERAT